MRGTNRRPARRVRQYAVIAAGAAIGLLATACGGHAQSPGQAKAQTSASAQAHPAVVAAELRITPPNGSHDVNPSGGISVAAVKGTVTNVTVRTSGHPVSGSLSDGGKTWHSTWTLDTSQSYTVTATGSNGSQKVTTTSTFRTLSPPLPVGFALARPAVPFSLSAPQERNTKVR